MKKTGIFTKIAALVLVLCMSVTLFASCGSNDTVMSMTVDGKTYTISEKEYSVILTVKKLDLFLQSYLPSTYNTDEYWFAETEEGSGKTNEDAVMEQITEQVKAILVEKYLFDKYELSIPEETLENNKAMKDYYVKYLGGKGSFKQYFGYTADDYYDVYLQMIARSNAVYDYLYGENGTTKVTEDQLAEYYTENYMGFQFIVLDMNNKVVLDEDGKRVRTTSTQKDEEGKEITVENEAYKTEKLTDEEKSEKQTLAAKILAELEAGTKTFEELAAEYSDDYFSVEYPDGMFVLKDGTFINTTVDAKAKELEIGEYTTEVISVNSDSFQYLVKRVALKDGVYNDEKYLSLFDGFEDGVAYHHYEGYVESLFDSVVVDQAVAGRHSFADIYVSEEADANAYNYYYGNLQS